MKVFQLPLYFGSFALLMLFASCKKEVSPTNTASTPPTTTSSPDDLVKDSALMVSRDIYLWYNQIPATFNARSYAGPDSIMAAIRQYSNEPGFSAPVDRWSFAMKQSDWNNLSSGVSADFGLGVFFRQDGDLRVKSVERASPAGLAGIHRGWRILKINGNSNITVANADFIIQNVFYGTTTSFTFQKPDNSTVDISLNAATYQEHPVILDSVYSINGKQVGYFAFNSFLGDTSEIYSEFNRIFTRFSNAGVSDVIVDLRYNGGGYVSVSQKLADYLAPVSANNQTMMTEAYNDRYSQYNEATKFAKLGSLNLSRVFFIVSQGTASASELVINNLKPLMDVELVGPSKTYGKPVGFFPIPVGNWYAFPVSFRSTNGAGQGSYFGGLALSHQVADGLDQDWGTSSESCLASALSYITTGAYRQQAFGSKAGGLVTDPVLNAGNTILDVKSFKGSVESLRMK